MSEMRTSANGFKKVGRSNSYMREGKDFIIKGGTTS